MRQVDHFMVGGAGGSATRTNTFDAPGDLEDVWEPHLH